MSDHKVPGNMYTVPRSVPLCLLRLLALGGVEVERRRTVKHENGRKNEARRGGGSIDSDPVSL